MQSSEVSKMSIVIEKSRFKGLYIELKRIAVRDGIFVKNIMTFVVNAMELVENLDVLSGPEKKQLVLDLMRKIIEKDKQLELEEKKEISYLIDNILPEVIDTVVAASKNDIMINVKKRCCKLKEFIKKRKKCIRGY